MIFCKFVHYSYINTLQYYYAMLLLIFLVLRVKKSLNHTPPPPPDPSRKKDFQEENSSFHFSLYEELLDTYSFCFKAWDHVLKASTVKC